MRSQRFLKVCAVASSLLLGAAFVSYRAGALDWPSAPQAASPATFNEARYVTADDASPPQFESPADPSGGAAAGGQILYSSKSGAMFIPTKTNLPGKSPQSPARDAQVGGGKPMHPVPVSPQREMIMPGSKSPGGL